MGCVRRRRDRGATPSDRGDATVESFSRNPREVRKRNEGFELRVGNYSLSARDGDMGRLPVPRDGGGVATPPERERERNSKICYVGKKAPTPNFTWGVQSRPHDAQLNDVFVFIASNCSSPCDAPATKLTSRKHTGGVPQVGRVIN